MAQPNWVTNAGNLGTIPEGVFYKIPIYAVDPDGGDVFYELIAGQLPGGIEVQKSGTVAGIPKPVALVKGVPSEVSRDITSKFAVRAYTERIVSGVTVKDRIADRTFSLTVTGQNIPNFITPTGSIGTFYDGTKVSNLKIEFTDSDPTDRVKVSITSGRLPTGLTLLQTGQIVGIIQPLSTNSETFTFTVQITDGKSTNLRTFSIYVYASVTFTADTTYYTADNTFLTADIIPTRVPILLTPEGDLGQIRSDNFYAFKFDAIDFDNEPIEFAISVGEGVGFDTVGFDSSSSGFDRGTFSLPPGLTIDPFTGWFYGYIPNQGATEISYRFAVRVQRVNNPDIISDFNYFTITITGNILTEVVWLTDSNLGTINNGAISTLEVEAYNIGGRALEYRLEPDSGSRLPQGLSLTNTGHIVGKVSFNTFALDGGTTTFDITPTTVRLSDETTFDMQFNFTVNAFSPQTTDPGYQIATIVVNNGGSNYGTVSVTFGPPLSGTVATGTVTLTNGVVSAVNIVNPGSGYTGVPVVTIGAPGSGVQAVGYAVLSGGSVSNVVVTNPGSGYTMPTVSISQPTNSVDSIQATVGSVTTTNGLITNILVGNPGRGYLVPPTISITGAGGSNASASAILQILDSTNSVSAYKTFTVTVVREFNEPYAKLYIKAMPPTNDRALINQLIYNQDVLPYNVIYRADDPNFGVAKCVIYDHAYGLRAATLDQYAESLNLNHYWKNLTLGEIKTARALNPDGTILYEVIYSQVVDDLVNAQGQSVSKSVTLPYPAGATGVVYPNSLINMRDQVIDQIGQLSSALPLWMTSNQASGQVLGFTPAWVIAYVKPGLGNKVLYDIQQQFGDQFNKIDFKADRYELDRSQIHNWDPTTDSWVPTPAATTFDNDTTVFDLRGTQFIAPADQYTSTDMFDKYLLFPKTNILG